VYRASFLRQYKGSHASHAEVARKSTNDLDRSPRLIFDMRHRADGANVEESGGAQ
jgi:hypothetical protein